jgi:excisionase family DNA binding protein
MKEPSSKGAHGATVPVPRATAEASEFLETTKGVARATKTSPRTVQNWMRDKRIPFIRISRRCVRFDLKRVLAALRKLEVKPRQ